MNRGRKFGLFAAKATGAALLLVTLGGGVAPIAYTYDDLGRLTGATYWPSAKRLVYTYDAAGNHVERWVAVTANRPPIAIGYAHSTAVNTTDHILPLGNDYDPDADTLTITAVTSGAHGTTSIDTGMTGVYYAPATGFTGTDTFTYTISDGNGGTATATVTETVS